MIILYSIIISIFLFINFLIIKSDIKAKIIPNKYLLYLMLLVPIFYIYQYFSGVEIIISNISIQFIITLLISFLLYYYGIWSAGDAKFLLVLSLYILNIGVIPFIGNISLIIIVYLFIYFLYFYFGKSLFNINYGKSLFINIKKDLKEKWVTYKSSKGGNSFKAISNWLLFFLIIFVTIRIIRFSIMNNFTTNETGNLNYYQNLIQEYNIYFILITIIIFIGFLYLIRILIFKLKNYIIKEFKTSEETVNYTFIGVLFFILMGFIVYEFRIDKEGLIRNMYNIFTIYITLYLILQVLIYSYKITFQVAEYEFKNVKKICNNEIIDKSFLIKIFGKQVILGAEGDEQNKKGLLYPDPVKYIQNMDNPIDNDSKEIIKKMYKVTNNYHSKNKTLGFTKLLDIKVMKTFAFAPYIFYGFLVTYLFEDKIIESIVLYCMEIIKRLVNY